MKSIVISRLGGPEVLEMREMADPTAGAGQEHLATLAAMSRPLRDEAFVGLLRQAPDAAALHALLANV